MGWCSIVQCQSKGGKQIGESTVSQFKQHLCGGSFKGMGPTKLYTFPRLAPNSLI